MPCHFVAQHTTYDMYMNHYQLLLKNNMTEK